MINGASIKVYLAAIFGIALLAVGAIVALTIARPNQDNTGTFALLLATLAPTTAALLSFLKGNEAVEKAKLAADAARLAADKGTENAAALEQVEIKIDGRLTQLLEQTKAAEGLKGQVEGRAAATAERTAGEAAGASAADLAAVVARKTADEIAARVDEAVARVADRLMAHLAPPTEAEGDEATGKPLSSAAITDAEHVATEAVRPMKEQIQEVVAPLLEDEERSRSPPKR